MQAIISLLGGIPWEALAGIGGAVVALFTGWQMRRAGAAKERADGLDKAFDDVEDARRARRDAARGGLRDDDGFKRK